MTRPLVNCDLCGRDTPNMSRVCRHCYVGSWCEPGEFASAVMTPWTEWCDELESDYSEDSLGPKLAENRIRAVWLDGGALFRFQVSSAATATETPYRKG